MKKSLIEMIADYLGESVECLESQTITERRRIAEEKHGVPHSLSSNISNLLINSEVEKMFDEAITTVQRRTIH